MAIIVNAHRIIISNDIFIVLDGQRLGPYDEAEIRNLQATQGFKLTIPAWREGLENWVPLAELLNPGPVPPPPPDPSSWAHALTVKNFTNPLPSTGLKEIKFYQPQFLEDDEHDPSWDILLSAWKLGLFFAKIFLQTLIVLVLWESTFFIVHHLLRLVYSSRAVAGPPLTTTLWVPLVLLAASQMFFFGRFFKTLTPCLSASLAMAAEFALFVYHNNYSTFWSSAIEWSQEPVRLASQAVPCGALSFAILALAACLGRESRFGFGRTPWMSYFHGREFLPAYSAKWVVQLAGRVGSILASVCCLIRLG